MAKRKLTPAEKFWIGLGAYVLIADGILMKKDCATLSVCFGTWLQTPKGRLCCAAGAGALAAHLFWSVPLPGQTTFRQLVTYKDGKKIGPFVPYTKN